MAELKDLNLTKRQQEIFDFIGRYSAKYGYPPTVRDIGKAIGLTSSSTVHAHLANLAGLWGRDGMNPTLFVLENNNYGMGTSVSEGSSEPDLYKKGCAFRIHGEQVDGTDVLAVRDMASELIEAARREGKPALLEAVSYRLKGHSVVDPAKYRSSEAVSTARAHDPIEQWQHRLLDAGVLTEQSVTDIERVVNDVVSELAARERRSR